MTIRRTITIQLDDKRWHALHREASRLRPFHDTAQAAFELTVEQTLREAADVVLRQEAQTNAQ